MQYFFFRMQRVRVILIFVIVGLIIAAYWLMTASPKHGNIRRLNEKVHRGKDGAFANQRIDAGRFGGRLGRNSFPKSPDGKFSKDKLNQRKESLDLARKGAKPGFEKGQVDSPLKDRAKPLRPGDNLPKMGNVNLQRNWKVQKPAEGKNPSDRKKNPSIDTSGRNKFGQEGAKDKNRFGDNSREKNKFGLGKDKNRFGDIDVLNRNRVGDKAGKGGYEGLDKNRSGGQGQLKKPSDGIRQNMQNRNTMLDNQFALDRKQLKEALQKDRKNFKYLDGRVEAYARALGIAESVIHQNKKYENKPRPNVSPVPNRMGPPEAYRLTANKRPSGKFMPSVGNGHIATVVDSDTVLMNGLYSGFGNTSHRARIPSMIAFEVSDFHPTGLPHKRNYTLNMLEGIYTETISGADFTIEKRTYAHRSVANVLVSELDVFRSFQTGQTLLKLNLKNLRGSDSKDITILLGKCKITSECNYIHGKVNAFEIPGDRPEFHGYYDIVPPRLDIPVVPVGKKGIRLRWIFIASIAGNQQEAESSYRLAAELVAKNELLLQHRSAWMNIWSEGALTMDGNIPLSRAVFSAMYNTLSSLPANDDPERPFFGLSPSDLAHGNSEVDYSGHITSDQEIWMFPNILMFHSDLAKLLIKTRLRNQKAAQRNANENKFSGSQFPAETAYTGMEVGPEESKYDSHTSGDISHAIMQYIYRTKDVHFYTAKAKQLLIDITNFYQGRLEYNMTRHMYFCKDVISLDKKQGKVTNDVYTNTIAKIALSAPYTLSSYLELQSDHLSKWLGIANKTYIPYDEVLQYHPQYDGYKIRTRVGFPEALMLRYPLMQSVPIKRHRKDVSVYEQEIDGPATGWITLALNYLQLKDDKAAWSKLKLTMMNIKPPFQVWTEKSTGGGAKNYLTLMGGFLQAIINGYGGFRTLPDRLEFDPILPPLVKTLNLTSVDYMGSSFDFIININSITIRMVSTKNTAPRFKVVVYATGNMKFVTMNQPVLIARQKAALFPIGSPRLGKPVNDVRVQYMQPGAGDEKRQPERDSQIRPNIPGHGRQPLPGQGRQPLPGQGRQPLPGQGREPLPGQGRQPLPGQGGQRLPGQRGRLPGLVKQPLKEGQPNQIPPRNVQVPNENQQRFDRQSNSQGLSKQGPPRLGVGGQNANDLKLSGRDKNRGPVDNKVPVLIPKKGSYETENFKNQQGMMGQEKLKLQQGVDPKYQSDSGQPGNRDSFKNKIQKDKFDQVVVKPNDLQLPESPLKYDAKKKNFKGWDGKGFNLGGQKDNAAKIKKRLRKRADAGL